MERERYLANDNEEQNLVSKALKDAESKVELVIRIQEVVKSIATGMELS
ncbi:MAG: hypothetical protein ACRD38_08560 [Nitrososphaerales archaeon]